MNEYLELNRMALAPNAPKNSESRVIGITLRMIRKNYPHIRCILSFADGCQCGDGTIYRASGFMLVSYKKNDSLLTDGASVIAKKSLYNQINSDGKYLSSVSLKNGWAPLKGLQYKYVFFFDESLKSRFKPIDNKSVPNEFRIYKGQFGMRAGSKDNVASSYQLEEGGATPTPALQNIGPANE